jgi:hypothetical protein
MSPNAVIRTLPDEAQVGSTVVSAEEPAAGEALRKRAWSRLGDATAGLRVFSAFGYSTTSRTTSWRAYLASHSIISGTGASWESGSGTTPAFCPLRS